MCIRDRDGFVFPSYVEDILGPTLFDFGYGPFRWCCLSRKPEDLAKTDEAAAEYIKAHTRRYQDHDNYCLLYTSFVVLDIKIRSFHGSSP